MTQVITGVTGHFHTKYRVTTKNLGYDMTPFVSLPTSELKLIFKFHLLQKICVSPKNSNTVTQYPHKPHHLILLAYTHEKHVKKGMVSHTSVSMVRTDGSLKNH